MSAPCYYYYLPGKNQAELIAQYIGEGVKMDRTIVPSKDYVDFLRYEVTLAEINTWAIAMIGPYNFGVKWSGGRARPEEIAFYIAKHNAIDMVTLGVPADIVANITAMKLEHPFNFTAYPEGSPTHPSWPAMHSAASVVSFWLPLVTNMTKDQICEAKALDFGVSYGRTLAGGKSYLTDLIERFLHSLLLTHTHTLLPFFVQFTFPRTTLPV
jgi:hypothetical protein